LVPAASGRIVAVDCAGADPEGSITARLIAWRIGQARLGVPSVCGMSARIFLIRRERVWA
jgi:hypothetical protein